MPVRYSHDVLVIGSGAAGLSVAIQVATRARVAVICKGELSEGATAWAQGGIAAVLDTADSTDQHVADTLLAGAGLCREDMVRYTVEHSRESIQWLIDLGVAFTKLVTPDGNADYHLAMEGGHSRRRIIHAADATGRAVSDTLIEQARRHKSIEFFEHHIAVNLTRSDERCIGAYVLNEDTGSVDLFQARVRGAGHRRRQQGLPVYQQPRHAPPAMASPWPGAPAAAWPTWNSTSSIRPASIIRTPSRS